MARGDCANAMRAKRVKKFAFDDAARPRIEPETPA